MRRKIICLALAACLACGTLGGCSSGDAGFDAKAYQEAKDTAASYVSEINDSMGMNLEFENSSYDFGENTGIPVTALYYSADDWSMWVNLETESEDVSQIILSGLGESQNSNLQTVKKVFAYWVDKIGLNISDSYEDIVKIRDYQEDGYAISASLSYFNIQKITE
ncbi:hypothetical protein BN3661_01647 [Eubacteriaceae bacterium CHKCI005]|nr:hypothetical protein BN3661_01647 [Eubacteriaceae bacterium CHKCI005]